MEIDVSKLLGLPAADRLELADILRSSVGFPAGIETLLLPAWQQAHMDQLLKTYSGDRDEVASGEAAVARNILEAQT